MGGGKRRALKKLLNKQQNSESPSPYDTPVSSEPLDIDAILAGDDAASAPPSPEHAKPKTIPVPPSAASNANGTAGAGDASPAPSQASAPAALGGGGLYGGSGHGIFGGHGGQRSGKKSSKQRFAERQARKQQAVLESAPPSDPNWNAQLEAERQEEIRVISNACGVLGRSVYEVQPDGHCMYAAVADQLGQLGVLPAEQANNPYHTRRTAAKYMREHQDDFLPFLASVDGEDMPGATDDGIMTPEQYREYCHRVESTAEWGGEPEIQALSRAFNIPIHVIQCGPPVVVSHGGQDDTFGGATTPEESAALGDGVVRISYHRRMYGLGEHYNSLRVAPA